MQASFFPPKNSMNSRKWNVKVTFQIKLVWTKGEETNIEETCTVFDLLELAELVLGSSESAEQLVGAVVGSVVACAQSLTVALQTDDFIAWQVLATCCHDDPHLVQTVGDGSRLRLQFFLYQLSTYCRNRFSTSGHSNHLSLTIVWLECLSESGRLSRINLWRKSRCWRVGSVYHW